MDNSLGLEQLKIVDESKRIFEGIGSVGMSDNEGSVVTPAQVARLMPKYLARGGGISDEHSNRQVGKIISWRETTIEVTPELVGKAVLANPNNPAVPHILKRYIGKTLPAIAVRGQVFKDFPQDDAVWNGIKNGDYKGLSFGGNGDAVAYDEEHQGFIRNLTAMWEFALVRAPRVALALLTGVNEIAQSDSDRKEIARAITTQPRRTDMSLERIEKAIAREVISMLNEKNPQGVIAQTDAPGAKEDRAKKFTEDYTPADEGAEREKIRQADVIVKDEEDGEPIWHVFYANETKSRQFKSRADAQAFKDSLKQSDGAYIKQADAPMDSKTAAVQNPTFSDKSLKKEKESDSMAESDNPSEDSKVDLPAAEPSENRTEAPAAVSVEALSAKLEEALKRIQILEGSAPADQESAPADVAASEDPEAPAPEGEEKQADEETPADEKKEAPAEEKPAEKDEEKQSDEEAPAEDPEKKKEIKQSSLEDDISREFFGGKAYDELDPNNQRKFDNIVSGKFKDLLSQADDKEDSTPAEKKDDEVKQSDKKTRLNTEVTDARGTLEIKQSGTDAPAGISAYDIARGATKVGWSDLEAAERRK